MYVIDFRNSRRKAFAHGFMKGLAAPVMLFHSEQAPALPQVQYLVPPTTPIHDVIASDWRRIGADIARVIERHGKTAEASS